MYVLLDIGFFIFHSGLILFNLSGWIWETTRPWNLVTLLLTGFSWFFLGIWYGWGYCPCTDWHWQVRRKMGDTDIPNSYIKFLIEHLTGFDLNAALVDAATVFFFFGALITSLYLNYRDFSKEKGT